jgi:putative ABC transport system substrate-binding protein
MKKKLLVLMALMFALAAFAACSSDDDEVGVLADGVELVEGDFLIASLQIAAHPALDGARNGFVSGMAAEGFVLGQNLEFEVFNALGDMSNAHLMAAHIVDMSPDLILRIATGTSQALAAATDDIPITITAVTSPYGAGLVESHARPGGNLTGTTDLTPVAAQLAMIMELWPETEVIGMLYNAGENNSVIQANMASEAAAALGVTLDRMSVAVAGDLLQATEILAGRVDIIYTPTCNLVAAGMVSVVRAAEEAGLAVIAGDAGSVQNGALLTYGIDYYLLGRQTAVMAAQILRDGADPATMPIQSQTVYSFAVNITSMEILGIELPQHILDAAEIFED